MEDNFSNFFSAYLIAQVILLPFLLYYLRLDYKKASLDLLRRTRITVSLLAVILPLALWITASVVTTQSAQQNTTQNRNHSQYDATVATPIQVKPMVIAPPVKDHVTAMQVVTGKTRRYYDMLFYIEDTLLLFSMAGLIAFLGGLLAQSFRLFRLAGQSLKSRPFNGITLFIGEKVRMPFSLWLAHGLIFLPESLSEKEYNVIMEHELCHIKWRHTAWAAVESLMAHIFWFNPCSHLIKRQGDLFRELECDAEVAKNTDYLEYSRILVDFAKKMKLSTNPYPLTQAWGGQMVIEKRIQCLLFSDKQPFSSLARLVYPALFWIILFIAILIGGNIVTDQQTRMIDHISSTYGDMTEQYETADLDNLPHYVVPAFLLQEDAGFYAHKGVDYPAIVRATVNNLKGGELQGASTISQQLAKNLVLEDKSHTIWRKIKQIKTARILEHYFTKEQLLEFYLNSIYLGAGKFGIKEASQLYFGHCASGLTPAEAAMLAVMVSNPEDNSHKLHPARAKLLQQNLLDRMVGQGELSEQEASQSFADFWQAEL